MPALNNTIVAVVITGLVGVITALVTGMYLVWVEHVKKKATIESKKTPDVTQLEVTHINSQAGYVDDLRADIALAKADIEKLKALERESGEKWYRQQDELLDKQGQINELKVQAAAALAKAELLEKQVAAMELTHDKHRVDCEKKVFDLHTEITALHERCHRLEDEKDAWREKYREAAGGVIGNVERPKAEVDATKKGE